MHCVDTPASLGRSLPAPRLEIGVAQFDRPVPLTTSLASRTAGAPLLARETSALRSPIRPAYSTPSTTEKTAYKARGGVK